MGAKSCDSTQQKLAMSLRKSCQGTTVRGNSRSIQEALRLLERLEEASAEMEQLDQEQGVARHQKKGIIKGSDDDISTWFPLFLPMDRDYEAKYLDQYLNKHTRSSKKSNQEKIYLFLEHPSGWFGFLYHMLV